MKLSLSKSELLVLKKLCDGESTPSTLAEALGFKESFVSRLLKTLDEKGMITTKQQGTSKKIMLCASKDGQSFKQMYTYRRNSRIEDWLSGYSLELLIIAGGYSEMNASLDLIVKEASFSKPTLYSILKKLRSAGVISVDKGVVRVTDRLVGTFANDFADGMQLNEFGGLGGYGVSLRVRKHVVLRIDKELGEKYSLTGLNALAKNGLNYIKTSYNDYYFNLDGKKRILSVEEAFVHALLLANLPQHQDFPLLAQFLRNALAQKKVELNKIELFAKDYYINNKLTELRNAISYAEKMKL